MSGDSSAVPFVVVEGAGQPVVLVHGVAGSYRIWDKVAPRLRHDHQVVRLDLLGYGRSPAPRVDYTAGTQCAAIRRGLARTAVAGPVVLVGLSMGGLVALDYARRWPDEVRALVVIGLPYHRDAAAARRALCHDPWVRQALEHRRSSRLWIPPLWWLGRALPGLAGAMSSIYTSAMAQDALRVPYRVFCSSVDHVLVGYRAPDAVAATAALPRLFLHGAEDQWASPGAVTELVAGAPATEVEVVPAAGHNLAVLAPSLVADRIRQVAQRAGSWFPDEAGSEPPTGSSTGEVVADAGADAPAHADWDRPGNASL